MNERALRFMRAGGFTEASDALEAALAELDAVRPEGAIGRLERFVASGGDTEVLLEGLPEAGCKHEDSYPTSLGTVRCNDCGEHFPQDESRGHH